MSMESPTSPISDVEKGTPLHDRPEIASRACSKIRLRSIRQLIWRLWRKWLRLPGADAEGRANRDSHVRTLDEDTLGYRSLSTFLDSDENFMLYRRFGYLHSRTLLRMQDKLRKLEDELDAHDDAHAAGGTRERRRLTCRDADEAEDRKISESRTRTKILDEIDQLLDKYDSRVLKAQRIAALNKPTARDWRSVEAYIFDKRPLVDEESCFIYRKDDLITLRDGRDMALLDSFIEKMLQLFHCSLLQRIFCSNDDRKKTNDPNLHYYSKSRKDYCITTILTLVLLCLLILPVFVLYKLTVEHNIDITYTLSIGVLLLFTLIFSAVLSLFTQAKRHEIFGAAAAYCAVLVVFISNIPGAK